MFVVLAAAYALFSRGDWNSIVSSSILPAISWGVGSDVGKRLNWSPFAEYAIDAGASIGALLLLIRAFLFSRAAEASFQLDVSPVVVGVALFVVLIAIPQLYAFVAYRRSGAAH